MKIANLVFWNLSSLNITLNENATVEAVEALIRNITFTNSNYRPDVATRKLSFYVADDHGDTTATPGHVALTITPHDDPYTLTTRGSAQFIEDTGALPLDDQAKIADPDDDDRVAGRMSLSVV